MKILCFLRSSTLILLFLLSGLSIYAQTELPQPDKSAYVKGSGKDVAKYYTKRFVYPLQAIINSVEGTVAAIVRVSETGVVEDVRIQQGLTPAIDEAVRQLIMTQGEWRPAMLNKKPVNSEQLVSLFLRLTDSQKNFAQAMAPFKGTSKFPLFVIDGKLVNDYVELEPYNVKSIRILKGDNAKQLYGEAGKNGVVEMQTKRGTPPVF